ncbi:MAG: SpoIIE family protein phosphatase [Myxococcales bacterium]|nr:SpoIIE family protein phosphatase [Myxococcales bacterium]MBK7198841.1 SpoIIE family protein phosphatase [Myxococcales bacterium]MBP6844949.1 SpoIIE family protein phosphatase [Kofleriaceae bacterium]
MTALVFIAGPNTGRRYALSDGEYVIGRRSDCQIFVPDMRVSRQHARLRPNAGKWEVEDLGSNNGTWVNGARIAGAQPIRHGDEIAIASNRIRVESPDEQAVHTPAGDARLTIVDAHGSVVRSREESGNHSMVRATGVLTSSTELRHLRLLERKLTALTAILDAAAKTPDPDALLEAVLDPLLDMFPDAETVGVLVEEERTGELQVKHHKSRKIGFGGGLRVPGTIITHVVQDRRGVLLGEAAASGGGEVAGTRMGAPLSAQSAHYGVIYVEGKAAGFRQEDVDLLQTVAYQTALAIHAARVAVQLAQKDRLERDLRVARQIQRSLLPAVVPQVVGLDFAVHYEPAYQIGGDFYDFIWHDEGHLGVGIGDVAGKAISAALYMARLSSELRSRAGLARTPARLLRRVNEEMVKLGDDGMFATLVYAIYELETRTLVFTNAGHCVPLLRRGERVFPLQADRAHIAPIGVVTDLEVGEARVQLHAGDMLVLVTDGILEARDPRGNEYGMMRLSRRLRTARGAAEDVVKAILQDVDSHVGSGGLSDDITVVAMGIDERRARRRTSTVPGVPIDLRQDPTPTRPGVVPPTRPGSNAGPGRPGGGPAGSGGDTGA